MGAECRSTYRVPVEMTLCIAGRPRAKDLVSEGIMTLYDTRIDELFIF